jgi:hypothetical protein
MVRSLLSVLFFSASAVCQLPSSACDEVPTSLADCAYTTKAPTSLKSGVPPMSSTSQAPESQALTNSFFSAPLTRHESFHWGRALFESFTFLSIEQAYVVHDDYRWVVYENGIPFNHYWRDYKDSLSTWINSGWDDGDPLLYSYVGHPIQGALTQYIQIQNDPQGRDLEVSNTKGYWWSRFKAFWWSAAYSTQWNIGPLSELTVEKYGTIHWTRTPWTHSEKWPCYEHCVSGVGQVDLVTTPVGGTLWLLTEDILDKQISRRVEGATRNHFVIDLVRCSLNPVRGGANILHGKKPWYRASRDASQLYLANHAVAPANQESH